jgi:hypothetical protein
MNDANVTDAKNTDAKNTDAKNTLCGTENRMAALYAALICHTRYYLPLFVNSY